MARQPPTSHVFFAAEVAGVKPLWTPFARCSQNPEIVMFHCFHNMPCQEGRNGNLVCHFKNVSSVTSVNKSI